MVSLPAIGMCVVCVYAIDLCALIKILVGSESYLPGIVCKALVQDFECMIIHLPFQHSSDTRTHPISMLGIGRERVILEDRSHVSLNKVTGDT